MDIPSLFSDQSKIMNFDFSSLQNYIDSDIDFSTYIDNLSPSVEKHILFESYFKSILLGYNHIFISKILKDLNNPSANICLPLLHQWIPNQTRIDNLVIISHPEDSEKICKYHIKKTPIFKSLLK